jgi:hypothetical protein
MSGHFGRYVLSMAAIFEIIFSKQPGAHDPSPLRIAITFFARGAHRVVIGASGITP